MGSPGLAKLVTGLEVKACAHTSLDHNWSWGSTESSGTQKNASANFSGGLRLPNTPFPTMTTGGLLVVFADAITGDIADVQLAHAGQNAFVVPRDGVKAYFVVNDLGTCPGADASLQLSVAAQVMVDAETAAKGTLKAMAKVLERMRALSDQTVDQGRILPSQKALARSEALAKLDEEPHAQEYPAAVRRLFDAYVDKQLVATERRVELVQIEREQRALTVQIANIEAEQALGAEKSHLQSIATMWTLRALDGRKLRSDTVELLRLVRIHFLPILELWYPSALDAFSASTELDPMLGAAQITSGEPELGGKASIALDRLYSRFRVARQGQKTAAEQFPITVVSIPNPGYQYRRGYSPSVYNRAEVSQQKSLWDAIAARKKGLITIRPEDLYSSSDGHLSCKEHNPVIQRMAIYVVRPGEPDYPSLNATPRRFEANASSTQVFARESGPTVYTIENAGWQSFELPIVYGEADQVVPNVLGDQDVSSQRPIGLSPFASFEVDFSSIAAIERDGGQSGFDRQASEILVVMQLDSRNAGVNLPWVRACSTSASPAPTTTPGTPRGNSPPILPPRGEM
jgi:hypothetical protein